DPALRVERGARVMVLLARVVGGHQVLAPILNPFFSSIRAKAPPSWVTSPPVSAPTGSPASLMALAGGRATPWPWRLKHSGSSAPEEVGFAVDSLLEGTGFEPSVPRGRARRFVCQF